MEEKVMELERDDLRKVALATGERVRRGVIRDGNLPYEITRGSTKKKLQRVSQMQKGTEQPHVWRVLQDSIADSCVIVLFLVFGF